MSTPITGNIQLTSVAISNNPNLVPTGIIIFAAGNRILGTASLDNTGTASITIPADLLGPGTWDLVAYYPGDSNFAPGTSVPLVEVVTGNGTQTNGPYVSGAVVGELNGDVTGLELSNVIKNIQNNPVGAISPSIGQVLTWTGVIWAPENPPSGSFAANGDLEGTGTNQVVIGLQHIPISSTAPSAGQILEYNGEAWAPSSVPTFVPGGDLTGNISTQYVQSLSGTNNAGGAVVLNNTYISADTNKAVLKINENTVISSNEINNLIISNPSSGNIIMSLGESSSDYIILGDIESNVSNTGLIRTSNEGSGRTIIGINTVGYGSAALLSVDSFGNSIFQAPVGNAVISSINGVPIFQSAIEGIALGSTPSYGDGVGVAFFENAQVNPSTSPSNGALLYAQDGYLFVYQSNGLDFQITPSSGETGPAGGDLTGTYPDPTIAKLQGVTLSSTSPANGQALLYDGFAWVPETITASGAAGGDLTGSYPNPTIAKLQGVTLTASSPSSNQILQYNGSAWVPTTLSISSTRAYYGNGADGAVAFNGTNTFSFATKSGSSYYLSRNVAASSVTVSNSVTVFTSGYGIFCNGTFTNDGTVDNSAGLAGAPGVTGFYGGGSSPGPGDTGSGGGSGASLTGPYALGFGGKGGSGGGGSGGSGGSTVTEATLASMPFSTILAGSATLPNSNPASASQTANYWGGAGGGGGTGYFLDFSEYGGEGGGGGGLVVVTCLVLSGSGTFSANGGNGSPGTGTNASGGGGGGGGVIVIVYGSQVSWTGSISVAFGTGGASGGGTGSTGDDGYLGTVVLIQG